MRRIFCLLTAAAMLAGCATHKPKHPQPTAAPTAPAKPAKLEMVQVGKIVRVNELARFVVLNYTVGNLPGVGTHLAVYRQNLKVGEIKVTGPQQDDNTVADIVNGDVQAGDETRGN